jgi:hypothetical protein
MAKEILGIGSRVKHPEFGDGVVIQASSYSYTITFMQVGIREISHEFEGLEVIDVAEMEGDLVSLFEVEERLINILRKFSDVQETVELGNRWLGGKFILQPADKNLKGKEVQLNAFFAKIIMLRDRLRVLEQRINSHDKLTEEDKVNMQQYITRCYGSLTTFNVLFKNPKDQFVGEKGTKD